MFEALSARRGEGIAASAADPEDVFSCPKCYHPVRLRVSKTGAFQSHFSHVEVKDCDAEMLTTAWTLAAATSLCRLLSDQAASLKIPAIEQRMELELPIRDWKFVFLPVSLPKHFIAAEDGVAVVEIEAPGVDGEIEVTKAQYEIARYADTLFSDGQTFWCGQVERVEAQFIQVGRAHPVLGRAFIKNPDVFHPTKLRLAEMRRNTLPWEDQEVARVKEIIEQQELSALEAEINEAFN